MTQDMKFKRRWNSPDHLEATTPSGMMKIEADRQGNHFNLTVRFGDMSFPLDRAISPLELYQAAGTFMLQKMADIHCLLSQDRAFVADLVQRANLAREKQEVK